MGKRLHIFAALSLLIVSVSLSSCIEIEDLGEYWDRGIIDPILEGKWKAIGKDKYTIFAQRDGFYNYSDDPDYLDKPNDLEERKKDPDWHPFDEGKMRTLMLGDHTFMMINSPDQNLLIKYDVLKRDHLVFYGFNAERQHDIGLYAGSNVAFTGFLENVLIMSIGTLDKEVAAALWEISEEPEFWVVNEEYERVRDDESKIYEEMKKIID